MPSIYTPSQVLEAIASGDAKPQYTRLAVSNETHEGELLVFGDALEVEGTRVSVTATLQQQAADALGCLLLTPKIADLLWLARTTALLPITGDVVNKTDLQQSREIDAAIAHAEAASAAVVQTVGKHWVISNQLLNHPGKAENYGWHFPGSTWAGSAWEPAVTPGLRLVQGQGWAHDSGHSDYSQTCVLVHRACTVDGQGRDLAEVLQDPDLSKLVSHEGPLKILRQPGTTVLACAIPDFGGSKVSRAPFGTALCPMPPPPGRAMWPWVVGAIGVAAAVALAWEAVERR